MQLAAYSIRERHSRASQKIQLDREEGVKADLNEEAGPPSTAAYVAGSMQPLRDGAHAVYADKLLSK
eukprot:scaffold59156_cov20-Tisochrysis_lutea.AAC.3